VGCIARLPPRAAASRRRLCFGLLHEERVSRASFESSHAERSAAGQMHAEHASIDPSRSSLAGRFSHHEVNLAHRPGKSLIKRMSTAALASTTSIP
jgi:hypothetical protein